MLLKNVPKMDVLAALIVCPVLLVCDIPKNFRIWNDLSMYGNKEKAKQAFFQELDVSARADQCKKCGKCETVCPQSIAIRENLKAAAKELNALKEV